MTQSGARWIGWGGYDLPGSTRQRRPAFGLLATAADGRMGGDRGAGARLFDGGMMR